MKPSFLLSWVLGSLCLSLVLAAPQEPVREAPQPRDAAACGIGSVIRDREVTLLKGGRGDRGDRGDRGSRGRLSELASGGALVVAQN